MKIEPLAPPVAGAAKHNSATATSLVPGPPQPSVSANASENDLWYHLQPMHVMPCVDSRRVLKNLVLRTTLAKRWDRLLRKHARLMTTMYAVGLLWRLIGMAAPPSYSGGPFLVLALLLQLPGILATSFSLCYEFVWHAAHTYDFWFFGLMNLAGSISLAFAFQDVRVCLCVATWIEIENARLADAMCTSRRMPHVIVVSALCACFFFGLSIAVLADGLEIHSIVIWQTHRGYQFKNEDIIVTSIGTVALLLARLAFRKRNALRTSQSKIVVKCICYRCRLKFEAGRVPRLCPRTSVFATRDHPWRVQVHARVTRQAFRAADLLLPQRWTPTHGLGISLQFWVGVWKVICVAAVASSWYLLATTPPLPSSGEASLHTPRYTLVGVVLVLHVITLTPIIALHQRQLFVRVVTTFDFLFIGFQGTLAMLSVCHLFRWRLEVSVFELCMTLGYYVIMTADSLTPDVKRLLGLRAHYLVLLAACLLVAQLLIVADFTIYGHFNVTDRILFEFPFRTRVHGTGQHRVAVSVIPFLISRFLTTVLWISQVVWRLWFCESEYNDLILLQGGADYDHVQRYGHGQIQSGASVSSTEARK